jgi:hypothetical protein
MLAFQPADVTFYYVGSSHHQHNIISWTMAPKSLPSDETEPKGKSSTMRRSDSESSFVSVPEDGPVKDYRDYRVRKSGLIA